MKSFLLSLAFSINYIAVFGQTQFQLTIGSAGDDLSYQIVTLEDGSLIATGSTNGVAGNGWDSYLIKFNPQGQVVWSYSYGDLGDDASWDVISTQNNEIVAVGVTSSLGTPYSAATISKADTAGNILWLTGVYDTAGSVEFYRVMESSTGYLLAIGLIGTTLNQDNILLCKFTPSGNLLWSKSIGSAQSDEVMGITETPEGNYLLAGLTNYSSGNGSSDFAAVKTDTAGNVIWKKNYGGTSGERLNDVLAINNAYYFCGWSTSAGQGGNDIILMKTDTAGTISWVKAYGTAQNDRVFNMLFNRKDSTLLLAGYTDYSAGSNNRNTFLMNINLNGNLNWGKSYGGNNTDGHWPTGITRTRDEGYYLFGISNSFSTLQDDDLYLIKTDALGNTACNQKNPQFIQSSVTGWAGTNFGTANPANPITTVLTLTGSAWNVASAMQCCQLYADAGPDKMGCISDTVGLGSYGLPGYTYNWMYQGNPISARDLIKVSVADSGTYYLYGWSTGSACDSIIDTVEVIAYPQPLKPVITTNSFQLTSTSADFYQWFLNGDSIAGANSQTFQALVPGVYAVLVTNQYGCSSLSDTVVLVLDGVNEIGAMMNMVVFPNPASDNVYLLFGTRHDNVSLRVFSVSGNQVYAAQYQSIENGQRISINLGYLPAGIYHVGVRSACGYGMVKIVIME